MRGNLLCIWLPMLIYPFRCFLGDVHRELMERLSLVLHDALGSYLRDAVQESDACLHITVACVCGLSLFCPFFCFFSRGWIPLLFL
jgi:hypothetical protein